MNQLAIVILSKELKYSLANDKIKTLEKAIQLLPKLSENQENKKKTIRNLADKYDRIKDAVQREYDRVSGVKRGRVSQKQIEVGEGQGARMGERMVTATQSMGSNTQQIQTDFGSGVHQFYKFMLQKCICQIYGSKGCGKTSLLLHLAQVYAKTYKSQKSTKILLYNCVSGFTAPRLEKLKQLHKQGIQIQCIELPTADQLPKHLSTVLSSLSSTSASTSTSTPSHMFIGIDMLALLLIPKQKPKLLLSEIFSIVCELVLKYGVTLVFTNLIQHRYEVNGEDVYNSASYFCQSSGEYVTHKIFLEKVEKKDKDNKDKDKDTRFRLRGVKGKVGSATFGICQSGVEQFDYLK